MTSAKLKTLLKAGAILSLGISIALGAASCGGGQSDQSRQLVAMTVQPSNGDAIAPSGTLPFTATGTFNQPPTTQTNLTAQWTSSNASVATIDASTGLATCVTVGGPITITASATGNGGTLSASAMLGCSSGPPVGELGHCQLANNTLTGYCLGVRSGFCHEAYDPNNCPPGQPPTTQGQFLCGSSGNFSVDGSRDCTP